MGATLDETQLELEAQRARVRGTADRLETATRRALDIRALIGRHPGRTIGLAAGVAYFLLGGPHRTVRAIRGALGARADGEKAYAALPPSLRAFVDASAPGFGASKAEARGQIALALHAWRADPKNRKKADRLVSETLTPPGPERAFWALVEVAAVTAAGIIAKQVVARRLGADLLGRRAPVPPVARPNPSPPPKVSGSGPGTAHAPAAQHSTAYTGWSGRTASDRTASRPNPAAKSVAPTDESR